MLPRKHKHGDWKKGKESVSLQGFCGRHPLRSHISFWGMSIHGDCLPTVANLKLLGLCCWKPKFLFWNKKIWRTGCLSTDVILILNLVAFPKISSDTKHFVKSLTPFFPNPCRLVLPSLFPQRPPWPWAPHIFFQPGDHPEILEVNLQQIPNPKWCCNWTGRKHGHVSSY